MKSKNNQYKISKSQKENPADYLYATDSNQEKENIFSFLNNDDLPLKIRWKPTREMFFNWQGYIWGLLLVVLTTILGHLASAIFSLENIIMFYLLVVVISAIYWGLGPSIIVSISTVVVLDYFFIQPVLGFIPFRTYDIFTLAVLLIVSFLISYLAARFRQKSEEARRHEREVSTLYYISRNLAKFTELESSVRTVLEMSNNILDIEIVLFLPDPRNKNSLIPFSLKNDHKPDPQNNWVAFWSFQNRSMAGPGTNNFPEQRDRYYPLMTPRGAAGVMLIKSASDDDQHLPKNQYRLLQAFVDLIAVCIDNIQLAEEAKNTEVLKAKDKLQTAILNSLSHDLRTPLVSVIGVLSSLQDEGLELNEAARKNLIQVAYEDANRLNSFIANLLDISRIESGAVKLLRQPSDIAELISVALERLENRTVLRPIKIDFPSDLPFIEVDSNLIVQVFVNILDNALKYSQEGSPIEIIARKIEKDFEISFLDRGIGIPPSDLNNVFDKFYRVKRKNNTHGTGLGLSICKGIIESHGGYIKAENRPEGGAIIKLSLPVSGSNMDMRDIKNE